MVGQRFLVPFIEVRVLNWQHQEKPPIYMRVFLIDKYLNGGRITENNIKLILTNQKMKVTSITNAFTGEAQEGSMKLIEAQQKVQNLIADGIGPWRCTTKKIIDSSKNTWIKVLFTKLNN